MHVQLAELPTIDRCDVGHGSVTHFAFLPGVNFPGIDPFVAEPFYNDDTNYTDGTRPYLEVFLAAAGVQRRVELSALHIEAPLLSSSAGSVVTLLNWGQKPVDDLGISVLLDHDVSSVRAVNCTAGELLSFHSYPTVPAGRFRVNVTMRATLYYGDFVLLEAK